MPHRLLLADDSVTIQRVIKLTFADEDVDVETVGDGDQAVASIDKAPPDIVLADVAMPGRTGYDVAQHIRDTPRLAHIPVVLLTGAFEPVDEVRALQVGCDAVLAKPFEPELVVSRVRDLLSRPRPVAAPTAEPVAPLAPNSATPVPSPGQKALAASTHAAAIAAPQPAAIVPAPIAPANIPAPAASGPAARIVAAAVAPAASAAGGGTLGQPKGNNPADIDAYFDRLDEAFATLAATPRSVTPTPAPPTAAAASASAEPVVRSLVEAFEGLLGPEAPSVTPTPAARARVPSASQAASLEPAGLSEAQMSQIVDRVVERLPQRLGAGTVNDIVTRVAERLVREEIAQIKKRL